MSKLSSGLRTTIAGPDFAALEHRRLVAQIQAGFLASQPVAHCARRSRIE
jgi:hypothetical protein